MTGKSAQFFRVLTVNDQGTVRSTIRNLLVQNTIRRISEAEDGIETLQALLDVDRPNPDVIICDLHMERMDGLEFCNKLRRSKDNKIRVIPVLILTGERDQLSLEVAEQVGATTVLGKPISTPDLCQQIESAIGFRFSV